MNERKLYPDIRLSKWARTCQVIALAGFGYCLLANAGCQLVDAEFRFGFALLYLTPALFLIAPFELLVLLITVQSWKRWADSRQRILTLMGSTGGLLLLGLHLLFMA